MTLERIKREIEDRINHLSNTAIPKARHNEYTVEYDGKISPWKKKREALEEEYYTLLAIRRAANQ